MPAANHTPSDAPADCTSCDARTGRHFCNFGDGALANWNDRTIASFYPFGTRLFTEGQPPRGVFLVCSGRVKLTTLLHGRPIIRRIARTGELLGIREAISGKVLSATAEAMEPVQVRFMKRSDFLRFSESYIQTCFQSLRQLSHELDVSEHLRTIALEESTSAKIARFLVDLCNENGRATENGIRIRIDMSHRELAQLLGTSRETITRRMSELRKSSVIQVKGSTVFVRDKKLLEQIIQK